MAGECRSKLDSRLLRAAWINPEGSESREDWRRNRSIPVWLRICKSDESGKRDSRRIQTLSLKDYILLSMLNSSSYEMHVLDTHIIYLSQKIRPGDLLQCVYFTLYMVAQ